MNREQFKKDFKRELSFFNLTSKKDLEKGFTIEQVEDELFRYTASFYGARLDFDDYAEKKCYFIATYAYQIIRGNINEEDLDYLCDEIEEEEEVEKKAKA